MKLFTINKTSRPRLMTFWRLLLQDHWLSHGCLIYLSSISMKRIIWINSSRYFIIQFLSFLLQNNSKVMQEERIYLMKDLEFIRNSLPDSFCFGFFQVDVKEVKTIIVQSIEKNISIIDKSLNERIETILKES